MAQTPHHLRRVDAVPRWWGVVFKVQQTEETLFLVFLQNGQTPLHHRVIRIQEVHPVATVIQVVLGQSGHTKHVLVAERNSWEGHVVSPHHVNLCDSRVRHQVEDSVPGPGGQETHTHNEGHAPDETLWFGLVW